MPPAPHSAEGRARLPAIHPSQRPPDQPSSLARPPTNPTKPRDASASTSRPCQTWVPGKEYEIVPGLIPDSGKLVFVACLSSAQARPRDTAPWVEGNRAYMWVDQMFEYFPFCKDFGPYNLSIIWRFSDTLIRTIKKFDRPDMSFVLLASEEPEHCTNVACLIASWLILELHWSVERAWAPFRFSGESPFIPFRDTTEGPVTFPLSVEDVLRGLHKAKHNQILSLDRLDIDLYEYADHPLTADLHEVVPGRFLAFRGPSRRKVVDKERGIVRLAPTDYLPLFEVLRVSTVVRLNQREYDEALFTAAGLKHADLYFEDCTIPDAAVLKAWFDLCRASRGVIAVHCKAGLGRTGTLIAVWLMRKYRFTAREAIGYLRVMRPGSVIGPQQHFLEAIEDELCDMGDPDLFEETFPALQALVSLAERRTSIRTKRPNAGKLARLPQQQHVTLGFLPDELLDGVSAIDLALQNTGAMLRNTVLRAKKI